MRLALRPWLRFFGQLRAKCPSCPQLKHALLVLLRGGVLFQGFVCAARPLLGCPPRRQFGARALSRSIGTGALFIHLGALEDVNCCCLGGFCGLLLEKNGRLWFWKLLLKFPKAPPLNPVGLDRWNPPVLFP